MIQLKKEDIFVIFLILLLAIFSFFIVQTFILPLIFTFLLVYILNPIYYRLKKVFRFHFLTSVFTAGVVILVFLIPIYYSILGLSAELNSLNSSGVSPSLTKVSIFVEEKFGFSLDFTAFFFKLLGDVRGLVSQAFDSIPKVLFELFLIVFFYYYFSKSSIYEFAMIREITRHERFRDLEMKVKQLLSGIVYGQIFVRFVQGVIGAIGFLVIGIPGAFVFGILIFFTGFIPLIGTGLVWIPLVIKYLLGGHFWIAFFILIVGFIVSVADNFLLPYVISEKTNVGPVMTLVSIIGGIKLFGIYGLILGPFVIGLLFLLVNEVFAELSSKTPRLRKYVWTEEERHGFRKLKTDAAREQYIRLTNEKYARSEKLAEKRAVVSQF